MCKESKVCSYCKSEKPIAAFSKSKERKDGLRHQCKQCDSDQYKAKKDGTFKYKPKLPIEEGLKVCNCCGEEKQLSEFNKQGRNKDGSLHYNPKCRVCMHKRNVYLKENPLPPKLIPKTGYKFCNGCGEELPLTCFGVRGKLRDGSTRYNSRCSSCNSAASTARYYKNHEEELIKSKKYRDKNPELIAERQRIEGQKPQSRLARNLRRRLRGLIKGKVKSGSAIDDLGCSINWFMDYMAWYFTEEMTWDNHGTVWHIDHIIPLAIFDLTDRGQLLVAVHYTNMQPLLIADNLSKGAKLNWKRHT